MNQPRVSIVTPMYNAEKYIGEMLESMLAQTFTDFEFIIVDDGSTDNSPAIVDAFAARDARVRVIHLPKNAGNARANNRGFLEARGTYIACMDADDVAHPERLEKQVAYMDAHPDVGLVATQYWKIDEAGHILRKARNRLDDLLLNFHLLFGVPVCNPSVMYRQSIVKELGPEVYRPAYIAAADYDFIVRVARRWKMHVVPEYLFYYRINSNGLSKTRRATLVAETVPLALDHARTYGALSAADEALLRAFLPLQLDQKQPLTAELLATYVRGMRLLRRMYVRKLGLLARLRVWLFALEVEAKVLLGRYKLRAPALLVRWGLLRLGIKQ